MALFAIQNVRRDTLESDPSAGKIALKASQSKGLSVESPNLMDEEWEILIKETAKRMVDLVPVKNGVFFGTQSAKMVSMPLLAASAHLSAQTTCLTSESPVRRNRQEEVSESQ